MVFLTESLIETLSLNLNRAGAQSAYLTFDILSCFHQFLLCWVWNWFGLYLLPTSTFSGSTFKTFSTPERSKTHQEETHLSSARMTSTLAALSKPRSNSTSIWGRVVPSEILWIFSKWACKLLSAFLSPRASFVAPWLVVKLFKKLQKWKPSRTQPRRYFSNLHQNSTGVQKLEL